MMLVAFPAGWSRTRTAVAVGVELLWAQAHGSFPLGVAILLVAAIEHARDRATRWPRAMAALAAALVTLVNPYGLRLHGLVRHYVLGDDDVSALIHQQIVEFRPLWRAGPVWARPPTLLALGLVIALAVSALVHRRHRARALFVLALAAMAVHQARHATVAIVVGSALLVVEIDDWLQGGARAVATRVRAWPLVVGMLAPGLAVSTLLWRQAVATRAEGAWIDDGLGGASVLALSRTLPDGAHTYAPFAPSALVLWITAPREGRVFFDPRNDCYSADVLRASMALRSDPNADRALVARGSDWAILRAGTAMFDVLARSTLWEPEQRDGEWTLFGRAAAARVTTSAAGAPAAGAAEGAAGPEGADSRSRSSASTRRCGSTSSGSGTAGRTRCSSRPRRRGSWPGRPRTSRAAAGLGPVPVLEAQARLAERGDGEPEELARPLRRLERRRSRERVEDRGARAVGDARLGRVVEVDGRSAGHGLDGPRRRRHVPRDVAVAVGVRRRR